MGKMVLARDCNLDCSGYSSVSGAVVTRRNEANFRLHLADISSAASKKRAVLEKKVAKCGNCARFKDGRCTLKKKKVVQVYNYCEYWSENEG